MSQIINKPAVGLINWMTRALTAIRIKLTVPDKGSNDAIMAERARKWFQDNGDYTLRLNYELDEKSVVFDVGGYKGEFAGAIHNKYDCSLYIFEPIPEFHEIIAKKFLHNKRVYPYCFGLAALSGEMHISLTDNSSSLFIKNSPSIPIRLKSIIEFMDENKIRQVELIKINIEGAEYDLLESLIQNNYVTRFSNIQVQFHDFIIENARVRMEAIQRELSRTHEITWQYEFVWENWRLKSGYAT